MPVIKHTTLTLGAVLDSAAAIRKISECENLDMRTMYRISRIVDKLNDEVTRFEKLRKIMFKKYGEPTEKGEYKLKLENLEQYQEELEELLDSEHVIEHIELKLSDVEKASPNARDLSKLLWLFEPQEE